MEPTDPRLPSIDPVNDLPRQPDRPAYTPVPGQVTGGNPWKWIIIVSVALVVVGTIAGVVAK